MPSATPTYAIPYPVGTDRVMDGDNAMQAIAERVELVWQFYYTEITVASGTTFNSKTVTWPTAFAAVPAVVANVAVRATDSPGYICTVTLVTATNAKLRVDKVVGAAPGSNTVIGIGLLVGVPKTVLA